MQLLTLLRAQLLFPLALFAVCMWLARFLRSRGMVAIVVAGASVFAAIAAFGAMLGVWGHMLSSSLATTAVAYLHGQALYPGPTAAERYALLYGPLAYLVYLPPALIHPDLRMFQTWTVIPAVATLLTTWKMSRGLRSVAARSLIVLQTSVVLITFAKFEWAPRADIWIVCFCALALLASQSGSSTWCVVAMSVAGAAVLDLKFSAVLLAIFPVFVFCRRSGSSRRSTTAIVLIFTLSASLFLLPRVSLRNYGYWIEASSRHGIDKPLILLNALATLSIFLVPLCLLGWVYSRRREETVDLLRRSRQVVAAIAVVAVFSVVTGAKRGAGPWHCVPLVPIACLCSVKILGRAQELFVDAEQVAILRGIIASLALALMVLGLRNLRVILPSYNLGKQPLSGDVAADIQTIIDSHPGKDIEMGYGFGEYELSWQRSLLVGSGSHFTLDVDSLADQELSGGAIPAATFKYINRCAAELWLVPKGEPPFTIENAYRGPGVNVPEQAFPPAFRGSFAQRYQLAGQSRFYDLYACRKARP